MLTWFEEMSEALRESNEASDKAKEAFDKLQDAYSRHDLVEIKRCLEQFYYWSIKSLEWLEVISR